MSEETERLQRIALQRLETLQRAGVRYLPKAVVSELPAPETRQDAAVESAAVSPTVKETPLPRQKASAPSSASTPAPSKPPAGQSRRALHDQELAVIQQEVVGCELCPELVAHRTQTVFGVGNPEARLCFFGEAPGADEDRAGEPFVGRAGKLLNDIISKGMGMTREEVYILNVLKCRPPGNRNPAKDEVANCRRFFERQLEAIQPEFICCLGTIAAQSLLETTTPVGRLRGQLHTYRGIQVVVTYHPAYLLRNPSAKTETWKDIKILLEAMGRPIPKRS